MKSKKKKVVITGASGFIGKNLMVALSRMNDVEVHSMSLRLLTSSIQETLKDCDVVFHLAGVNRPNNPEDLSEYDKNVELTKYLISEIKASGSNPKIVFSSSIKVNDMSLIETKLSDKMYAYAFSKLQAEEVLRRYVQENNSEVVIYRLPNVFGKWSKPNYNTVVATWCDSLINNNKLKYPVDCTGKKMELVHVDHIVRSFIEEINYISGGKSFTFSSKYYFTNIHNVHSVPVGKVYEILSDINNRMRSSVSVNVIPDMKNQLTRELFSTYMSFFNEKDFESYANIRTDDRGSLKELIKSENFGQIFSSTTKPGVTRGGHYHDRKVEKFIVLSGSAKISLANINEIVGIDSELNNSSCHFFEKIINVEGSDMRVINVPPGYAHWITNVGETDLITLFWSNELFVENDPDTHQLSTLEEKK